MNIEVIVFVSGLLAAFISVMAVVLVLKHKAKNKILIVDDNEEICKDLGEFLKKRNYLVHTTQALEGAQKIIQDKEFDYAIIDLVLMENDKYGGIKFFKHLEEKQPKSKRIILSGYPFEETREYFKEEGYSEEALKEIESIYIYKAKGNYTLAILDKLGGMWL